jgi:hypothetical protein
LNTLELRVRAPSTAEGLVEVRVLIDGRDLVDLARDAEAADASADGQPQLAGSYSGLHPSHWRELPERYGDGRAAVLACECGEPGCWPLRARISIGAETVSWSDFEQPHRGWCHDGLGPFVFDRAAYESAIASVTGGPFVRDV